MEWFNFSDKTFLIFFITCLSLFLFLVFLIVFFALMSKRVKKYENRIKDECFTVRVYSIHVKTNKVIYFDRSNLKKKNEITISDFYRKFHQNDIEKVKSWIFSICVDYRKAERYLEADVLTNHKFTHTFSLFKLIKYDPQVGVIHLERHLLRYITPAHLKVKSKKKDGENNRGIVKRSVIEEDIKKTKGGKGFTFVIKFVYLKQKALTNDKIERFMIMTLKNEIYPFLSAEKTLRKAVELSDNEIALVDFRIVDKNDAMRLANSIVHSIKKAISIHGYNNSVNFSIGVVANYVFYQNPSSTIETAQETAILAYQNNQTIYMFDQKDYEYKDMISYRQNISDLIRKKELRFLFRPIIDASNGETFGYFQYTRIYNEPINNFLELSKLAEKSKENKTLLSYVSKHVFPKFVSERSEKNSKLFFQISIRDIENLLDIFPQIPSVEETNVIITFDEQEIKDVSYDLDTLNELFNELKEKKYQLALSLKDKSLLLRSSIYYQFDYFIAGAAMIDKIVVNNRVRLSIHHLIEQLLKFKKPIIATDLEGWQAIELIINAGISLVSSEAILSSNDMILPIDRRKIEKLKTMDKNNR